MFWVPRMVLGGAVLVIGGLITFAVTPWHAGAGLVAPGVILMMRGVRLSE